MPKPDLTPDCSRCDALCCVLLAFDASAAFAFDKPACVACKHLARDNSCAIHADLTDRGFSGCVAFTCYGAGQRITQDLFKARSWRDDPALMPIIDDAFRHLRRIHEALWLLQGTERLPQTQALQDQRHVITASLAKDWTEATLATSLPALRAAQAFLAALRDLPALSPPRR